MGLRFVKLTVNQDDPTSYHLYYGDEVGHPGTILTFFNWPNISKGLVGLFKKAGANVVLHLQQNSGHELGYDEISAAKD